MPGLNSLEAAYQLREKLPDAKLIFLTMHADKGFVISALCAGARGYVLKRCAAADLVNAIHQVMHGEIYVTPELAGDAASFDPSTEPLMQLTARERKVLQLVAEGKSVKAIAAVLVISPKTVTFHKSNIMDKLKMRTTAGLTQFALRHGVVSE